MKEAKIKRKEHTFIIESEKQKNLKKKKKE